MKDEKFYKDINKFYNSENIKRNLVNAGLILIAFEIMQYSIIDRVASFLEISNIYELKKNKKAYKELIERIKNKLKRKFTIPEKIKDDLLLLCSNFFLHLNVISSKDIEEIKKIRRYRNKLAHELINFIIDSDFEVELHYLF